MKKKKDDDWWEMYQLMCGINIEDFEECGKNDES